MATAPRNKASKAKSDVTKSARAAGQTAKRAVREGKNTVRAAAASANADSTINEIEQLRDDLVRLSQSVASLMGARAEDARDLVTEKASDLYDTGLDYARDAEAQLRDVAGNVTRQIERNPIASVGLVFGVGYLIGLLRRR